MGKKTPKLARSLKRFTLCFVYPLKLTLHSWLEIRVARYGTERKKTHNEMETSLVRKVGVQKDYGHGIVN